MVRLAAGTAAARAGRPRSSRGRTATPTTPSSWCAATDDRLGPAHDDGLQQALLSSWHRLDRDARELLQLLAVGGRPVAVGGPRAARRRPRRRSATVAASLAEATASGAHDRPRRTATSGSTTRSSPRWSPTTLTPAERDAGPPAVRRGDRGRPPTSRPRRGPRTSPSTTPAPASRTRRSSGRCEPRTRRQPCAATPRSSTTCTAPAGCGRTSARTRAPRPADRADLWLRASDSAWSAGEHLLAVRLREEAIVACRTRPRTPSGPCGCGCRCPTWRIVCGLDEQGLGRGPRAPSLELAEARCPEHAGARAGARPAGARRGVGPRTKQLLRHAAAAVRMARRTGSPEALAWALAMRSETPPWDRALEHATRALALAREVGDPRLLGWATTRTANRLSTAGPRREAGRRAADHLPAAGRRPARSTTRCTRAPRTAPRFLVELGQLGGGPRGAAAAAQPSPRRRAWEPWRAVSPRCSPSGRETCRAGRAHLTRARELQPRSSACRRPPGAHRGRGPVCHWGSRGRRCALAAQLMPAQVTLDPSGGDELLVVAARAAGDLAEEPGGREEAVSLLERVEELRGPEPSAASSGIGPEDLLHPARDALFAADRARCHGDADTADLWRDGRDEVPRGRDWCGTRRWRPTSSLAPCWCEQGSRSEAASALRHAARLATDLGAVPDPARHRGAGASGPRPARRARRRADTRVADGCPPSPPGSARSCHTWSPAAPTPRSPRPSSSAPRRSPSTCPTSYARPERGAGSRSPRSRDARRHRLRRGGGGRPRRPGEGQPDQGAPRPVRRGTRSASSTKPSRTRSTGRSPARARQPPSRRRRGTRRLHRDGVRIRRRVVVTVGPSDGLWLTTHRRRATPAHIGEHPSDLGPPPLRS